MSKYEKHVKANQKKTRKEEKFQEVKALEEKHDPEPEVEAGRPLNEKENNAVDKNKPKTNEKRSKRYVKGNKK